MPPKAIFKGQTICISGKLSVPKKDYEELITKYGGTIKESVTAAVTLLVSNQDDVKAATQKVATAQGRSIPIVQEGFVGACVTAKKFLSVEKFVIKGSKRKAAPAKAKGGAAPKKAKVVASGPATITDKVAVIAKSGLADEAAVVVETFKKAFGNASVTWDVELVLNDPEKGKDRFYALQLLADKAEKSKFWFVQNWGRTGMDGAVRVDGPTDDIHDAKIMFKKKYRQKTGNVWGQVDATFVEEAGKYKLLNKDERKEAPGKWQYYLHNKVDGKKLGWYEYEEDAAKNMEKYWRQYNTNEGLGVRFVQSDYFKYEVNFTDMIQTNTKSGMRRVIRRVPAGEKPSPAAPEKIPEKVAARKEPEEDEEEEDGEVSDGDEEDDAEAEEAAEAAPAADEGGAAAAAEGEAAAEEEPGEAAAGGRKPPPEEAEAEADEPAAAGGRKRKAPADEAEAEAEAPAAGGRKPPPDAAEAEVEGEAEGEGEAEAPVAGGRKPPPADEAETEDETMAATLPMGGGRKP
uniref:NAD(+) ADP-ribosyltransferase n=1 Tax=Alexandrium catenella TaxID=2925 RepID=A0A7S1WXK8_ALECA